MQATLHLDVFGTRLVVLRHGRRWEVCRTGTDGVRRPAADLIVPPELAADAVPGYLADLCHEWARPGYDTVEVL